jgi:hypothetical protein
VSYTTILGTLSYNLLFIRSCQPCPVSERLQEWTPTIFGPQATVLQMPTRAKGHRWPADVKNFAAISCIGGACVLALVPILRVYALVQYTGENTLSDDDLMYPVLVDQHGKGARSS